MSCGKTHRLRRSQSCNVVQFNNISSFKVGNIFMRLNLQKKKFTSCYEVLKISKQTILRHVGEKKMWAYIIVKLWSSHRMDETRIPEKRYIRFSNNQICEEIWILNKIFRPLTSEQLVRGQHFKRKKTKVYIQWRYWDSIFFQKFLGSIKTLRRQLIITKRTQ